MTLNLFISYRSTDSAKVDTLVSRLRSLTLPDGKTARYKVWQDKTDITPDPRPDVVAALHMDLLSSVVNQGVYHVLDVCG